MDLLTREEIVAFLKAKWPRGGRRGVIKEIPTLWFCRMVQVDIGDMMKYRDEVKRLPQRLVVSMSRFIHKWRNGEIEPVLPPTEKRMLITTRHVENPKPREVPMKISLTGKPTLVILPRPTTQTLPSFKDFFAPIDRSQKRG